MGAVDDYSVWRHTALDYTVNPFREVDRGQLRMDNTFPNTVLEAFRRRYESRAVIANHGLQSSMMDRQVAMMAELKKLGPPLEFQTISPTVDWNGSIAQGLKYGATEIEIWNTKDIGGHAQISYEQLKTWAAEMHTAHADR
jgi:hypothetical protein